ncbi:MAG TPA: glycosyltransferase family 4 protein [Pyrinomonadaceae bacterium]|jgi:glycosyltransferase involved in cell wall biosynthesis|nr:glycosyltransferase family 4 protein [Pyrinomonadaceae bacterium]
MKANVGIYKFHLGADGGGDKRALALAERLSTKHNVWLLTGTQPDVPALESYFDVDLSRVTPVVFDRSRRHLAAASKLFRWRRPGQLAARLNKTLQIRPLGLDVFVNNSFPSNLVCPARRGIYMCMFPHPPDRGREGPGLARHAYHALMDAAERSLMGRPAPDALDSYDVITANSLYTKEWIQRRWNRDSEVVYSACDAAGPPAEKEKIILHVGRFNGDDGPEVHHKRQDVLLEVFRKMEGVRREGWRLHFAGSVLSSESSSGFASRLVEGARGLPVSFHFNADLETLRGLYRRAAVYWHATGYGFDAEDYPAKQEHFGMTTVEAMSAGAVPVVLGSGGQREIVTHGSDGFLWGDLAGLSESTTRLINDTRLRAHMGARAVASSKRFSRTNFTESVNRIVERLAAEE